MGSPPQKTPEGQSRTSSQVPVAAAVVVLSSQVAVVTSLASLIWVPAAAWLAAGAAAWWQWGRHRGPQWQSAKSTATAVLVLLLCLSWVAEHTPPSKFRAVALHLSNPIVHTLPLQQNWDMFSNPPAHTNEVTAEIRTDTGEVVHWKPPTGDGPAVQSYLWAEWETEIDVDFTQTADHAACLVARHYRMTSGEWPKAVSVNNRSTEILTGETSTVQLSRTSSPVEDCGALR